MLSDREMALEALSALSPSRAKDYHDWIRVGMALHSAGCSVSDWSSWYPDGAPNHDATCQSFWRKFGTTNSDSVSVGTLFHWAKEDDPLFFASRGDNAERTVNSEEWDSISSLAFVISKGEIEDAKVPKCDKTDAIQMKEYIESLFQDGDYVNFVTEGSLNDKGKYIPANNGFFKKAEEFSAKLGTRSGVTSIIGDYTEECGVWVRINPMRFDEVEGGGTTDRDVTEFRHVLVESDTSSVDEQYSLIKSLKLPCAAIVHSGGKSIHAVVKINAGTDYDLAKHRINFLYEVLKKNGMEIDKANRNPSRLSRLPGIKRGDAMQYLIETNTGCKDWDDWKSFLEEIDDGMPDLVKMSSVFDSPPALSEVVVDGILRRGHKLVLSAPSKAGKSWALIQLGLSICCGRKWMDTFECKKGTVLYVNLEIDPPSFINRVKKVAEIMDMDSHDVEGFHMWNLRGKARGLSRLLPQLTRRVNSGKYDAIILDPLYKILEGDENSNSEMAKFFNLFDMIADQTGACVIAAHHFAKGDQSLKSASDRSSGAGVFGRDPDAKMDMTEIETNSDYPAFRIDFTLREFAPKKPVGVFFKFPLHVVDRTGELDRSEIKSPSKKDKESDKKKTVPQVEQDIESIISTVMLGNPSCKMSDVLSYSDDLSARSVRAAISKSQLYMLSGDTITKKVMVTR